MAANWARGIPRGHLAKRAWAAVLTKGARVELHASHFPLEKTLVALRHGSGSRRAVGVGGRATVTQAIKGLLQSAGPANWVARRGRGWGRGIRAKIRVGFSASEIRHSIQPSRGIGESEKSRWLPVEASVEAALSAHVAEVCRGSTIQIATGLLHVVGRHLGHRRA